MAESWKELEKLRLEDVLKYKVVLSSSGEVRRPLIALGMNPSGKTDNAQLSRTSSKLVQYAKMEYFDSVIIINVCPWISSTVNEISDEVRTFGHDRNMKEIRTIAEELQGAPVLLCFGYAVKKKKMAVQLQEILSVLQENPTREFYVIPRKNANHPPHPSRAKIARLVPVTRQWIEGYVKNLTKK